MLDSGGEINMPLKNTQKKGGAAGSLSPQLAVGSLKSKVDKPRGFTLPTINQV
jgi:hypothetical protein